MMKQFSIMIRSFADVQEFVELSSSQPFDITAGENQEISCKSLMAVLGLNFRHPLQVTADCDDAQFSDFCDAAARFMTI